MAIKGKIPFFGCCTFTQSAHSWASRLMGVVAQGRGSYTDFLLMLKMLKSASMSRQCCQKHLALLTVMPGHRGAFQHLTHWQGGCGGHGEGAWLLLGRMGHVCELIVLVVLPEDHKEMIKKLGPRPIDCCQN